MRRVVLILGVATAMLSACGPSEPTQREEPAPASSADSDAASATASVAQPPMAAPAPQASRASAEREVAEAGFVGTWAVTADGCASGDTWRFTPDRLTTAGEMDCAIEGAAATPDGWSLQAACADGPATAPASLTLAHSGEAGEDLITVSGAPVGGDVTLARCRTPSASG